MPHGSSHAQTAAVDAVLPPGYSETEEHAVAPQRRSLGSCKKRCGSVSLALKHNAVQKTGTDSVRAGACIHMTILKATFPAFFKNTISLDDTDADSPVQTHFATT